MRNLKVGDIVFWKNQSLNEALKVVQILKNGEVAIEHNTGKRQYVNARTLTDVLHTKIIINGHTVKLKVEPDGDGFHSWCPALRGCHSCGDTVEEALSNGKDAATAWIGSSVRGGDIDEGR